MAASRETAYAVTVGGDIRAVKLRTFVMAERPAGIVVLPPGTGKDRIKTILQP